MLKWKEFMNPQTSPDRDQATPLHSGPGPQQQPISTADSQRIIEESFTQTPQASSAPVTTLGQTATTEATRAHYASINSATYQQQARGTYAQPQQRYGAPQTGYPGPSPYGPQQPYPYGQTNQQAPYGYPQPGDAYGAPHFGPANHAPQYSIDYLNEIAAPPPKPAFLDKKMMIILGAAAALVLLVLPIFAMLGGNNKTKTQSASLDAVAVRALNLSDVAKDAQRNIRSGRLSQVNASLSTSLSNLSSQASGGKDGGARSLVEKFPNEKKSKEELEGRLEEAELNALFDRNYSREMEFELDKLLLMMDELKAKAGSKDANAKEVLDKNYQNLSQSRQQIEAYQKSTEAQ